MESVVIAGLVVLLGIGLYTGYIPREKWPWAERAVASIVILAAVTFALFWISKLQGVCLPPSEEDSITIGTVCRELFTLKHLLIGYGAYIAGLAGGLLFVVASKQPTKLRTHK